MWLLFLFVAVPIIEIALFIQVGGAIGLFPTLAIVIATAIIGTSLMRSQGMAILADVQRQMAGGQDPSKALVHGALILVAGVLLLTPGFFTDSVGLALLIPPVRDALISHGAKAFLARTVIVTPGARRGPAQGGDTINGEFEVLDDDPPSGPGNSGWTRS